MVKPGKPKLLKINNRMAVLELFRYSDHLTAVDIAGDLNISKTTIMKILHYFLDMGIIISTGKGQSTSEGGKRPERFKFNEHFRYAIGHHVTQGRLVSVITDLNGFVLKRVSLKMNQDESLASVIKKITQATRGLLKKAAVDPGGIIGVGVGIPGITNFQKGIVRFSPWFASWGADVNFGDRLKAKLGAGVPVLIDNEARFQVLAERLAGAGKGRQNIVAVDGGEGLVAGIIVKGDIKRGVHHMAGEIGHMVINPLDTEACVCGGRGCFESLVYESRLLAAARASRKAHQGSLIFQGTQSKDITAEIIFNSANRGDKLAQKLMDNIIQWYAIAFSNVIMMIDPDLLVVQGVYAKAGPYFIERLREKVNTLVLSRIKKEVEIHYSELGPDACVRGASLCAISEYFDKIFQIRHTPVSMKKTLS